MIELIGIVIEKLMDHFLNRMINKQEKSGCKKLYELYLQIDKIIKNSKSLDYILGLYLDRGHDSDWNNLNCDLKRLTESAAELMMMIADLNDSVLIYDKKLGKELEKMIGMKGVWLLDLYNSMPYSDKSLKEVKDFEIDFSKFNAERVYMPSVDGFEKIDGVQGKTIDFINKEEVKKFRDRGENNINVLLDVKNKLGDFIKNNCRYDELFL